PLLVNLGVPGSIGISPWADRVRVVDARYAGRWELPVLGEVSAPTAVLVRPDGYVAWVDDDGPAGLETALATWFGPPAASPSSPSLLPSVEEGGAQRRMRGPLGLHQPQQRHPFAFASPSG